LLDLQLKFQLLLPLKAMKLRKSYQTVLQISPGGVEKLTDFVMKI